ncbi:ABC transporter permease subunit [Acetobacterium woodii]|uniref:Polar amino acid ABC transport system permease protein n=1 Tax=Acetobacterium woodii (strain ATCC 29683 / DSM 1030 / JCM 2381 / KCTC 1655 / WB1) TaxID=931626 RepID=H6LJM0_ACEWD|nr:ABC transporter permease subunit [Acetobacterium woodii]AFA49948.1 polar amino acid ABC transport system permease protein [Acetobacterium woodii DSM 1030]
MLNKKRILTLLLAIAVMFLIGGCSAADEAKISSASDLNQAGYIIGVPEGTPPEEVAKEYMPKAEISYFTQFIDGVAALKSGKATAAIYDSSGVDRILLSNPDLVKLPDQLGNIEIATVVRLNSTDLNDQINAFIKQLHADGTADEMVTRWIDNIGGVMPDIPKPQNPEKKLTIITNGMTEPMNYYENGVLTGYDIEFIKRFANYANIDYEIITMDYSAMIPALQSGKGDIIISDFFKTDERGQEVLYSDAYVVLHNSVMIRKTMYAGNAETTAGTITSNDELNGKRVGFITGMVYIDNFRPLYSADEYEYNDSSAMLEALKSNKIDAFLTSQSKVAEIVEQNPDLIALPPYADNSASIGVSKTNTELGDKLDVVVKRMIADGSLTALTEKWMGSDETAKVLTPVTLTGGNGTLVAGVLGDDYPYSYYKDNELVGLEVDLARILASQLGMNLDVKAMDFSAIIPSITSGKIDLAFYLAYTPERAESIRFLTPIEADSAVAIVQNKAYTGSTAAKTSAIGGFFASLQESFNKTFIVEDRYKLVLEGLWTTIVISLLSLLFGSILGALICAMRKSRFKIVSGFAIVYIRLIQGVPIVLNLMILYYIIFAAVDIDPILIAVVGFSINFAAYSAEIFRTAIDATDKGQLEAAYALGFTKISSFFKVTLPQALRHILPIFKGEFISMVKMTSVVGYIAIQDLTKMTDIIRSRTFDAFFPLFVTAFIYFVITYLFIFVLGKVEVQVDPKRRKRVVKGITDSENSVMEVLK